MENTPILNMSLREYYNIIVNGGKITRNKAEQSKSNNDKSDKAAETIDKSLKLNKKSSKIKVNNTQKDSKVKITKNEKKLSKKKQKIGAKTKGNSPKENIKIIKNKKNSNEKSKMILKIQNRIFPIDYEIVPYQNYYFKSNKTIQFELNEKIRYYKNVNFESFKDRFLLFKLKKIDQNKHSLGYINEIKVDEDKHLTIQLGSVSEFTNETFPFIPLNQDKIIIDSKNYDLFLIDFTFCLKNNGETADFLIILTDFLFKSDDNKNMIENKYYMNCFSFKQNRVISRIENRKLILIEEAYDENLVFF